MRYLRRAREPFLNEEHALVLKSLVLAEKEVRALVGWSRVLRVVVELLDPVVEMLAIRDPLEVRERDLVLGVDPCGGLRRVVVFEPPVRVRDGDPVVRVDVISFPSGRVLKLLRKNGCGRKGCRGGAQGEPRNPRSFGHRYSPEQTVVTSGCPAQDYAIERPGLVAVVAQWTFLSGVIENATRLLGARPRPYPGAVLYAG